VPSRHGGTEVQFTDYVFIVVQGTVSFDSAVAEVALGWRLTYNRRKYRRPEGQPDGKKLLCHLSRSFVAIAPCGFFLGYFATIAVCRDSKSGAFTQVVLLKALGGGSQLAVISPVM